MEFAKPTYAKCPFVTKKSHLGRVLRWFNLTKQVGNLPITINLLPKCKHFLTVRDSRSNLKSAIGRNPLLRNVVDAFCKTCRTRQDVAILKLIAHKASNVFVKSTVFLSFQRKIATKF